MRVISKISSLYDMRSASSRICCSQFGLLNFVFILIVLLEFSYPHIHTQTSSLVSSSGGGKFVSLTSRMQDDDSFNSLQVLKYIT
jgi:hypothetical protein